MIRKCYFFIIFMLFFLNSCKKNKKTTLDIDMETWLKSTISFYKNNCKIIHNPAIKNDSLVGPDGKSFPKRINNKLVYTVPEKLTELIKVREDLIEIILDENSKIDIYKNRLYISGFYRYNQPHPYYIIYSDINIPWILKYDNKSKKYVLERKTGTIKNTGMDHSSINDKCSIRLYGVIRDLEIFTEIIFSEKETKYITKFISLGG